ncbi:MAG: DUF3747 domain-containing protein [Leptolyngbyaceae cyanobacterium RU_5_1]|nr:DUF3747 domain-containing protein [Leptolyngbyaceae cyanobacterium RU_5_1]
MYISLNLRVAALATLALASLGDLNAAIAAPMFGQQEVDPNKFVAIASPYGGNAHQLLIVEQISNVRPCWSESGSSPTAINPLLVEFDFTDICGRSTDSNGYSMRVGGEDLNWRYSLRAVKRGNDLWLVGAPNLDRTAPELLIGRTRGYTSGFAKFYLEPGWRLTKRSYEGASLGHIYLTNNQTLASLNAAALAARPVLTPPVATKPVNPVASVTPPVYQPVVRPVVTPAERPKPVAQNRRPSLWERIFGSSRRTTEVTKTSSVSVSNPGNSSTAATTSNSAIGNSTDFVVPTIVITQP